VSVLNDFVEESTEQQSNFAIVQYENTNTFFYTVHFPSNMYTVKIINKNQADSTHIDNTVFILQRTEDFTLSFTRRRSNNIINKYKLKDTLKKKKTYKT